MKTIKLGTTFKVKGDTYGKYEIMQEVQDNFQDKWYKEFWVNKHATMLTKETQHEQEDSGKEVQDKEIIAITNDKGHWLAEAYIVILNTESHDTCDNVRLIIRSVN